tara:strand:- start:414 stop:977 length:564 start_codon:yes stop_codon:yes gene_type:complete
MKLTVVRTQFGIDATSGILLIDDKFECYTLEDQYQAVKVMHETCIPEGTYDIKFRKTGGFHAKYSERYKNAHYGMLHVQDVPNFTYILIHTGNTDEHTSGCLIVGETQQDLDISKDGFVGSSTVAYKKMYAKVASELLQGKPVSIEYTTIQKLLNKPAEQSDVYKKLQEISGEIKTLNAKLDGKRMI